MRTTSALLLWLLALPCWAELSLGGHLKALGQHSLQSSQHNTSGEGRLNLSLNHDGWSVQVHSLAQQCDSQSQCRDWRLDRANLHWQHGQFQVTAGRHAISWGNGLIFNPVDVFNPFNPLAIDTEYKPGEDMLHAQYGLDNGDDIQALWVDHGDSHSSALKYHHFAGEWEWDGLLSQHRGEGMFALGASRPLGDWLWRGEWMQQHSDSGLCANHVVSNMQRFFDVAGQPAGLTLEWFHNGWGIDQQSTPEQRLELMTRLSRGELFTPGKHYVAISFNRQMHPLWQLGITHISEANNDSHISQLFSNVDLAEAVQLRIAVALPWRNSRLLDLPAERYLLAQLAWYF